MNTVREFAAMCGVGFVLGIVLGALEVGESAAITIIVGFSVLAGLAWALRANSSAEDPEAARQRRRAIAACARETLDNLEPPIAEEHYRAAFRRLCRAIADGRRRVRLVAGDRTVEVALGGR